MMKHSDPRLPKNNMARVSGVTDQDLWEITIPQVMRKAVVKYGESEAIVFKSSGIRKTWKELVGDIDLVAEGLYEKGLRKGDRIGIWSPNCYEWVLTQFASARIGAILVTLNPAYRANEVRYALDKSKCKAVVVAREFKTSDYHAMLAEIIPNLLQEESCLPSAALPELEFVITMAKERVGAITPFSMLSPGNSATKSIVDAVEQSLVSTDPINIQFTSGTTGSPKGATLTHKNIINNSRFIMEAQGLGSEDVLCIPVPLYHTFGMVAGTLGCLITGTKMAFPSESFDPEKTVEMLLEEGCTALYGVPTMFSAVLECRTESLERLRTGIMAGAPCPEALMKRCIKELGLSELTICYGMTETSPISFQTDRLDSLERRTSTVGRVHPHVNCKLVDGNGEVVKVGSAGEILVKGYSVMNGYWDDHEKNKEAIDKDGWFHTGDVGVIDEEGYCQVVGRVKDMIIRGGENIYPREIEDFLLGHPDILEVAVFGVPDDFYGEQVCAWIKPRPGKIIRVEDVKEYCKGRLSHFKIPSLVQSHEEFPITVTGKYQKFKMREAVIREIGA